MIVCHTVRIKGGMTTHFIVVIDGPLYFFDDITEIMIDWNVMNPWLDVFVEMLEVGGVLFENDAVRKE